MKKILVSACLLGTKCRYDGLSKPCEKVIRMQEEYEFIPCCPESDAGLSTPRLPCEIKGDRVIRKDGMDLTDTFLLGAKIALDLAKNENVEFAILKERSPSCGKSLRYDGTFSGNLVSKPGITAQLLMENHISVFSDEQIENGR